MRKILTYIEVEAMLRVTVKREGSVESWELEGKLAGEWAKELERCWRHSPSRGPETLKRVHLKAVSYIDADGKRLLSEMYSEGAEIKACGCMTRAIVEEIVREVKTRGDEAQTAEETPLPSAESKAG
jgi:hypothetical protein